MAADAVGTNKKLIYSIDDDESINKLMVARFTKFGCDIKTFTKPEVLLDSIKTKKPHLLILDINLGEGLTGFDILESIRFDLKFDFPIIIVSSEGRSEKVAHALEIGATDFLVKPLFRFHFEERIAEYINIGNVNETGSPYLKSVSQNMQSAKLNFSLSIQEVNPLGFMLLSSHLIKKGCSFWLSGNEIKKIVPSQDRVLVTVLNSSMEMTNDNRLYTIKVEIDPGEEKIVSDLRNFLDTSVNKMTPTN